VPQLCYTCVGAQRLCSALVLYSGGLMSGSHNKEESKIKLYAYIICTQRKPTLSCNKTDSKANRKPVEVERELLKHYSLVLLDLSLTNCASTIGILTHTHMLHCCAFPASAAGSYKLLPNFQALFSRPMMSIKR